MDLPVILLAPKESPFVEDSLSDWIVANGSWQPSYVSLKINGDTDKRCSHGNCLLVVLANVSKIRMDQDWWQEMFLLGRKN